MKHGASKTVGVLFGAKIETVDLLVIPPLMERCRGLIVLQAFQDGAVDYYLQSNRLITIITRLIVRSNLVILKLSTHHPKGLVDLVLVDMHFG